MKQQCVVAGVVATRFFVAAVPDVVAAARDVKLVPPTVAGRAKLPPPPLRFVAGVVIVAMRLVGAAGPAAGVEGDPGMTASSRLL